MGFNILGIAINRNLKEQTEELSKILNLNLEFDEEIIDIFLEEMVYYNICHFKMSEQNIQVKQ